MMFLYTLLKGDLVYFNPSDASIKLDKEIAELRKELAILRLKFNDLSMRVKDLMHADDPVLKAGISETADLVRECTTKIFDR